MFDGFKDLKLVNKIFQTNNFLSYISKSKLFGFSYKC